MPPKLAPPSQSPPLRRSARTAATSALDDRDRQIADLNAEKRQLVNELARQRVAHQKQTEALRKDNEANEERLKQVGKFLEVLERMDREQAEEEGWTVAEDE